MENSRVESHCKVPVAGCPLYLRLDRTVVAACRPASVAGLPAHFTEEKRGIFLPSPPFYRIFLRIVLLHVLSSVLYHELHRTRPGRSHCLLYVSADQFCCVLLLARIYSPEAANASEYSGENSGPRQVENCPLCRHDGPVGRHPFHRSMAGDLRRKSDPDADKRGSRCLCCRIRRTSSSVE